MPTERKKNNTTHATQYNTNNIVFPFFKSVNNKIIKLSNNIFSSHLISKVNNDNNTFNNKFNVFNVKS